MKQERPGSKAVIFSTWSRLLKVQSWISRDLFCTQTLLSERILWRACWPEGNAWQNQAAPLKDSVWNLHFLILVEVTVLIGFREAAIISYLLLLLLTEHGILRSWHMLWTSREFSMSAWPQPSRIATPTWRPSKVTPTALSYSSFCPPWVRQSFPTFIFSVGMQASLLSSDRLITKGRTAILL